MKLVVELSKGQLALCGMAHDRGRYALDTACITPEVVCVTDGRTLTVATHKPGAKTPSDAFMVSRALFKKAGKLAHKDGPVTIERKPDGEMKVSARKDGVRTTLEETDEVVGMYPDVRSVAVVPNPEGTIGIKISLDYLKRVVGELSAISADGDGFTDSVILLVRPGDEKAPVVAGVKFSDNPVDLILPPHSAGGGTKFVPGAALLMPVDPDGTDAMAITDNPLKKAPAGCESFVVPENRKEKP